MTLGQSKTRVLEIVNTGTASLSFDVEPLSPLVSANPRVVDGLAPEETQVIAITVTPTETGDFEGDIDYTPDIILIDSWRFGHAAIVNKCKKYCDENTTFIVEDDFRVYGEEEILKRYFNLKNLKRYDGNLSHGTWNFITFNL